MPSKQYEHQMRKKAAGICIICNKKAITAQHCQKHNEAHNENQKRYERAKRAAKKSATEGV